MDTLREFYGPNAGYVLELYDRFLNDPSSVEPETKKFFQNWKPTQDQTTAQPATSGQAAAENWQTILSVAKLAQDIRQFGHLAAKIDPLGLLPLGSVIPGKDSHGLTDRELRALPADLVGGPITVRSQNALEAIEALTRIYTSTIGFDFEHVNVAAERLWLRDVIEGKQLAPPNLHIDEKALLQSLTEAEVFEQFLQRSFPGKFRFSGEGVDMLVPMLGEVVQLASQSGIGAIVIGMAHRGRLNVLAHVLQLPYTAILAEFKDPTPQKHSRADLDWTGDVKYHRGAIKVQKNGTEHGLSIFLAPNPSHLEAIDPVIEGMARAAGTDAHKPGKPVFDPGITLPILIHGDASFPGQGIVAETLNLSMLQGYSAGGTIHVITNNQLGYTASPDETRSTKYASDLAKGFEIPIIHVNADDPIACIESIRIASAYRERFHRDFLIDLVGYRRHGHNESDEPTFTQPLMYETIKNMPTVRQRWATVLEERGIVAATEASDMVKAQFDKLQNALSSLDADKARIESRPTAPPTGAARRIKTQVDIDRLQAINNKLLRLPEGFSLHPKLERLVEKRKHIFEDNGAPTVDWATAELFAFSSILEDGIPIRFTGQDVERGTFSHRHMKYHDVKTGAVYTSLEALDSAKASFEGHNSPLTENAAIGFEYGYNVQEPGRLVIWEAQYGDFINGAQLMVDEFITSARAKWGQTPSLVLLLPHAYEGQGPDHSSGRLERFLDLAAETNMRVANCTTSAQYFHLLRRQALLLKTDPLPLVVMTPKGLLRHPKTASAPNQFASGKWEPVLDDPDSSTLKNTAERLLLCSGKIFVDLVDSKYREGNHETAIIRIEQLYPFPSDEVSAVISSYKKVEEVVWVQEEPENMGAWNFIRPRLENILGDDVPLGYVGRTPNASPAEGSTALHSAHHAIVIETAFKGGPVKEGAAQVKAAKSLLNS